MGLGWKPAKSSLVFLLFDKKVAIRTWIDQGVIKLKF